MKKGGLQKGQTANPHGRRKGSKNRFTTLKDAFLRAFWSHQIGGVQGLVKWGAKEQNRGDFYKIIARMLPTNSTTTIEHRTARDLSDAELLAIAGGSGDGDIETEIGAPEPDRVH